MNFILNQINKSFNTKFIIKYENSDELLLIFKQGIFQNNNIIIKKKQKQYRTLPKTVKYEYMINLNLTLDELEIYKKITLILLPELMQVDYFFTNIRYNIFVTETEFKQHVKILFKISSCILTMESIISKLKNSNDFNLFLHIKEKIPEFNNISDIFFLI